MTKQPTLKAPFPYFGGKSSISQLVWERFGDVRNYVEPFFGSGAVLRNRPMPYVGTETVNDMNGWLVNFWRALQMDPVGVAHFADWPVSELDLHARGDWLFYREVVTEFIERLRSDPAYYDVQSAGWWVWGQCCWIGTGWGPRKLPHLGNAGQGVNRQKPHLGDAGQGDEPQTARGMALRQYLRELSERLRGVRICCGDWSRVCGPTPTIKQGLTAVFLDPPYGIDDRADCYDSTEDRTVSANVREWCLERGDDPLLRIALCGYEGEHQMPDTWDYVAWKARGGYASQSTKHDNPNAKRERIWFSPRCLKSKEGTLW
jgi:DNA adenine methylase